MVIGGVVTELEKIAERYIEDLKILNRRLIEGDLSLKEYDRQLSIAISILAEKIEKNSNVKRL
jgi:hypothetical protein